MMPFSEEELDYIARLDAAADKELLRRELPSLREESLRTLEVATLLLKRGAAAGLTLAEIGAAVSRPLVGIDEEPSELERLCLMARAHADALYLSEDDDDDVVEDGDSLSSSDAEEWVPRQELLQPGGLGRLERTGQMQATQKQAAEPMECTSSSCLSSGTLFNGSFERSFGGSGRLTIAIESLVCGEDDTRHPSNSSRSGEDLLFDLDDHHTGGFEATEPCTPSAAGRSSAFRPSAAAPSPGVCSWLGEAPSLTFSPLHAPPCDFHPGCPGDCEAPNPLAHPLPTMARSVTTASALPPWQHTQRLASRSGPLALMWA